MQISSHFFNELSALSANERLLLDLIWRHGPITRKALAAMGGVTGASATRLTKRALELGLIEETISRTGDVGNPSRPLRRSQEHLFSAGVGLDRNTISFALVNVEGEVVRATSTTVNAISIDNIAEFVGAALGNEPVLKRQGARLLGVGLAIPGYRSTNESQWAVHWDFPDLQKVNIEDRLGEILGVPVVAERDAVAAAWAERLNAGGKGKGLRSYFLVYLAQGVGGAMMLEGQPVLGSNGNAGALGILFPYGEQPRPSAHSLAEYINAQGGTWPSEPDTDARNAALVSEWIKAVAPGFLDGLNKITRLFDPGTIILGGSIPRNVLEELVAAIDFKGPADNYTAPLPTPKLEISDLNEHSLLIGAASLPVARLLAVV